MIPTEDEEQEALFEWVSYMEHQVPESLKRTEQWKDIANTNGLYMVSNTGRVVRLPYTSTRIDGVVYNRPKREIAQTKDKKGYLTVGLMMDDGNRKSFKVHRLVMIAFSKQPNDKPQINHIDSDKTNNCLWNLEWVDQHENMEHSVISGTKWTKPVKCINDGIIFKSMRSAERYYGIGHKEISKCCHGAMETIKRLSFKFVTKEEARHGVYRTPRTTIAV
jgi:hypothetical protein